MDPLSVTASVAGLLTAAHEVAKLLGPYVSASRETPSIVAHVRDETESTRTVLIGLQTLVRELSGRFSRGGALVGVDQVVAILTSGVLLFAELEGAVQGLVAACPSPLAEGESTERISGILGLSPTQHRLPLWARMKWASQEESLRPLLARLQGFKVSVTVVLTLLQCDSDHRAQQLQMELAANVSALLESNYELSRRMVHLEDAFDLQTIRSRQSIMSVLETGRPEAKGGGVVVGASPAEVKETILSAAAQQPVHPPGETTSLGPESVLRSVFEFESDLETSRVYRRVQRDTMDFSFRSSIAHTHAWSTLSGFSLADISVLSVIALPLDLEDIANRNHYINTNDVPMVEEELSAPMSEPSIAEERSIFYNCLRIHSQLLQITGFQELFNRQWLSQCREKNIGTGEFASMEDSRGWIWQQLDVFRALKGIFRNDVGFELLFDEFSRYDWSDSIDQVTELLRLLLSCDNDSSLEDNVFFVKILASLNEYFERLAIIGAINLIEEDNLDALISSLKDMSPGIDSPYKQVLEKFVNDQRLFVQNLLDLVSASEKMAQNSLPLLVPDQIHITTQLLSYYASSEIELLLTAERMLLAPPHLHLWAAAIRQWSVTAETHRTSMMIEEQKARRAVQDVLSFEKRNNSPVQRDKTSVTNCLELLSKSLQMFPRTPHFFQEILGMLLGDLTGIGAISPAQKNDFTEGERLLKYMLRITEGEIGQSELSQALQDLIVRVKDWKSLRFQLFGGLIRVDGLSIATDRKNEPKEFRVYLFENVVLCLAERKLTNEIRPRSFRPDETAEEGNVIDQPYKLLMKGRIYLRHIIDVHCYIRPGSYEAQIWWQSDDRGVVKLCFSFWSEWQMVEWCRCLLNLIRSRHQSSTAPNILDAPLFVQTRGRSVPQTPYANRGDGGEQDHQDNTRVSSTSSVRDIRIIEPMLHVPPRPLLNRPPPITSHHQRLSPPLRLQDRRLLMETLEEGITGQGDRMSWPMRRSFGPTI
ncbi:Pleckstrin homology domain-containing protein [Xylaria cubensis]|nr:Pleckstrin homology domain-containing protein [Xylaria cubensis]